MIESFEPQLELPTSTAFLNERFGPASVEDQLVVIGGADQSGWTAEPQTTIAELLDVAFSTTSGSSEFDLDELSVHELVEPMYSSNDYQGYTVYYSTGLAYYQITDGGWNFGSSQPVPPQPDCDVEPPPLVCMDTSQLSPEELRDYKISVVAAAIAREILAKPDVDLREYAAFILQDANGNFYMSRLFEGGPVGTPMSLAGMDPGDIVGIVHSHTANTWAGNDFKLYPTPNSMMPDGQGDWAVFDGFGADMQNNLRADGHSDEYVDRRFGEFRQYILGPTGPSGTGQYQLRGYSYDNRDTTSLGQLISLNLGLCNI